MRFELQKREAVPAGLALFSPFIALLLTLMSGAVLFASLGVNPLEGLFVYFLKPLLSFWELQELLLKAAPLIMIGVGLCIAYQLNAWNIGAEGQFIAGALAGSVFPILMPAWQGPLVFPAMMLAGMLGGALFALIPAFLKVRFGASEILTSLMLVYIAQFILDWLVRGPWRDPEGFNFPESRLFHEAALAPLLYEGGRLHIGVLLALAAACLAAFYLSRTLYGFQIQVAGRSAAAARFAGFRQGRLVMLVFALSGGLAGLAGLLEVAGPIGQLQPVISPGYGFTAIIVAFLGRLNPLGAIAAGLILALSYLGGEAVQTAFQISDKIARVFQGLLLFFILACDSLIFYRIRRLPQPNAIKIEAVS